MLHALIATPFIMRLKPLQNNEKEGQRHPPSLFSFQTSPCLIIPSAINVMVLNDWVFIPSCLYVIHCTEILASVHHGQSCRTSVHTLMCEGRSCTHWRFTCGIGTFESRFSLLESIIQNCLKRLRALVTFQVSWYPSFRQLFELAVCSGADRESAANSQRG